MDIDKVNRMVERIQHSAGDPEVAHSLEDGLREDFIQHVALTGTPELAEMAKAILSTNDMEFPRWCA